MSIRQGSRTRLLYFAALMFLLCFAFALPTNAQTETTGAFRGRIVDEQGNGLPGIIVRAVNTQTGIPSATRTGGDGGYNIGLLQPGIYTILVNPEGTGNNPSFRAETRTQRLTAVDATTVLPDIVVGKAVIPTTSPTQPVIAGATPEPGATPGAQVAGGPTPQSTPIAVEAGAEFSLNINTRNATRRGIFTDEEVRTLPLGATTLTRTFDELALLLPGVALPPQTLGNIAGPGVGPGVGSAGQFAVNGLRSRSNNFTVDGSDNNDEDIGVRRQGFFTLVPQPIESIQEYQVITLLAPAQYGRNIGAQVNAVSKSGGNQMHGTIYGFFNSSQLNARNAFDRVGANTTIPLQARALSANRQTLGGFRDVFFNCLTFNPATCPASTRVFVSNNTGEENSFTLGQGGLVLGGPLIRSDVDNYGVERKPGDRSSLFYFISAEGQVLNASEEQSFAVPTVEERGIFRTGATGIFFDPLFPTSGFVPTLFPSSIEGSAILSLFPFPNNPNGIYGRNTYTTTLPANAQGKIFSGKLNGNFTAFNRPQEFVARYNFTDDFRDIPVTGGALFSTLRPRVRTQNFSTFLNTNLSPASARPLLNQLRASYGRTRLVFDEVRDNTHLIPSDFARTLQPGQQSFLLNAPLLLNVTLPGDQGVFFLPGNPVIGRTVESAVNQFGSGRLAPIGQVNVAGYSPIGVDVFNFPQRRVNNTYQLADTMTKQFGEHNLAFGVDIRRTELNSDLPRNARPLLTFNAFPNFAAAFGLPGIPERNFFSGVDFAAGGAPSGIFQALTAGNDATINLRYYQYNFFGQDEWRIRRNLSLSFGLRYEYNTVPKSANNKIENTFKAAIPAELAGLSQFINGRSEIFDVDKNNFAPRVGIAFSPEIFENRTTVFRAGAGIFYDQILGAVISQSRNVFPNVLNTNFSGFDPTLSGNINIFPPSLAFFSCGGGPFIPAIQPGTLNTLNPNVPVSCLTSIQQQFFQAGFPVTLPERKLKTPTAYHYSFSFEQQVGRSMVFSAAYVGTQGRHLLRQNTPNLGPNALLFVDDIFVDPNTPFTTVLGEPAIFGFANSPITDFVNFERPVPTVGGVTIFSTDANSSYNALQLQMRGRFGLWGTKSQFQAEYTFSKVEDDVSDVFDLAGAPALPQNSRTRAGERAAANFDARHRFSYNYINDLSDWGKKGAFARFLFKGTEVSGTGIFQTGQPFTVNTIFDMNLDGNLTDRPNTTTGIQQTGDRGRPLRLTVDPATLLAPIGQDGAVPRNSFRASNLWVTNVALIKNFMFDENQKSLVFRMEVFNVFNRANYGIPVRFLEFPGFGQSTDTVTPGRRIQFAVKYNF
jgi:hypothetical protein